MGVIACTRLWFQGGWGGGVDNYIMRVVSLAHDTPSGLYLCLYQILLKYFKQLRRYEVHKNLAWKFGQER